LCIDKETVWNELSDRQRVKTLLAMGFIPTWLEELLQYADLVYVQAEHYTDRALKAEEKLRKIQQTMKTSYDGNFEELWNGLVEVLDS